MPLLRSSCNWGYSGRLRRAGSSSGALRVHSECCAEGSCDCSNCLRDSESLFLIVNIGVISHQGSPLIHRIPLSLIYLSGCRKCQEEYKGCVGSGQRQFAVGRLAVTEVFGVAGKFYFSDHFQGDHGIWFFGAKRCHSQERYWFSYTVDPHQEYVVVNGSGMYPARAGFDRQWLLGLFKLRLKKNTT